MEFLSWHYTKGINYYFESISKTLDSILHYLSLSLLLKTLFQPWKRLVEVDKGVGFNLHRRFEVLVFNLISRGIGASVRLLLFFTGIIFIFLSFIGAAVGIVFWLIFPFFGYPVYLRHKRSLENFIAELLHEIKSTNKKPLEVIFLSSAGRFLASHLRVSTEDFIQAAESKEVNLEDKAYKSFSDIIRSLLESGLWRREFLSKRGIEKEDLILAALWWDKKRIQETKGVQGEFKPMSIALELTFGYTPTLNKYSIDLSIPQPFSHHLIGRGEIVSRIQRVLTSGMSVVLVGQPGVGKKTVVLEFAKKASGGHLGAKMSFKRVLEFDYNLLLSEATDINQKKASLSLVLSEAASAGNIILMIRDIHRLVNPDVEGYDFTDIFEEYLEKRDLKIIAVVTNTDYERFIVPNLRIRKFLEKVEVVPPDRSEALEIIIEAAEKWETLTGLTITVPALRHIIDESDRYVTETPFPEKALELLDSVVVLAQQKGIKVVGVDEVNLVLEEKTGISLAALTKEEKERLSRIEEIIHERLVNQDTAISLIAKTLRAKMVGVIKEDRPLGSFLFLGPTGVGKTETAKVLAKVYYGSEKNIQRFDMAEYSGTEGLERLIGSVRKNLPGALTTSIKNKPASLLLLDEIEKASKKIYDLFLSLLDEGVITDAFGKKIICRHLFVIATSNAGAEYIRQLVDRGVSGEDLQKEVVNFVLEKEIFSPEFLNRFDGVVVYEPLKREDLVKIARLMLSDLKENLSKKNIFLEFDDSTVKKLSEDGYEPAFGARPMKRIVNIVLGDLIGKAILNSEIKEGDRFRIVAGSKKEEFRLQKIVS